MTDRIACRAETVAATETTAKNAGQGIRVYLGRLTPELVAQEPLFPPEREEEVAACRAPAVRQEKRGIWRLLLYALCDRGLTAEGAGLYRAPGGGWRCRPGAPYISLSHSGELLAVALSDVPVGVDLEVCPHRRLNLRVLRHMVCPQERERYPSPTQQRIAALWTAKESLYKRLSTLADAPLPFSPPSLNTLQADVASYLWASAGAVLSLAPGGLPVVWHRHPSVVGRPLPCPLPPQER